MYLGDVGLPGEGLERDELSLAGLSALQSTRRPPLDNGAVVGRDQFDGALTGAYVAGPDPRGNTLEPTAQIPERVIPR